MTSFYKIALPSLPLVLKKENDAMSSFVLFGIFDLSYNWVALSVLSLSVVLCLSLRAFERTFFMLLSSSQRDGDNNLKRLGKGEEMGICLIVYSQRVPQVNEL